MEKDYIKDYAVAAFRFYAKKGKPTYEEMREQIKNEAQKKNHDILGVSTNIPDSTVYELMYKQNALDERIGELLDILAVSKVINILSANAAGRQNKRVVEIVYFDKPFQEFKKNEFSLKITNASLAIPCSERQVYRYLKNAINLFGLERGLRMPLK